MANKVALGEQVKIKKAEIKDADRIAILGEQLGYSLTSQQVKQRLAKIQNNNSHIVYVATLANEYVIGWTHAHIYDLIVMPTSAIILGLVVDKDYRHSGIGRCLMQQVEQWASLAGCEKVVLNSNIKRKEAHLFYKKIGYINIKQSLNFQKKINLMKNIQFDTFTTHRLVAEPLQSKHLNELYRMHQNKQVMATLGGVRSDEETRLFILNNLNHWQLYGFGLWVFRDKVNNQFVGRAGLRNTDVEGNEQVELAYALTAKFWGRGLATEMGEEILKIGFELLKLPEIVCFTLTNNKASQRVMEKLGFKYERDIIHATLPHLLYRLTV